MSFGKFSRRFTAASMALASFLIVPSLRGQSSRLGGSVRGYQFVRVESVPDLTRWDTELWLPRMTGNARIAPGVQLEAHGLVSLLSPARVGVARLATSDTLKFLPLQHTLVDSDDAQVVASFDRLNLQFDLSSTRIIAGRQAVTWGVSYFWPALDLFAPFPPQIIDREYKPGVDAVRCTVALGPYSELDVLGASLGPAPSGDWAAGALARFHAGFVDLGLMGGKFHRDTVFGGFFTSNLRGTGVRGELSWTDSGDADDIVRNRPQFWRATIGVDRQLTPTVNLTAEFAWNGYGTSDATEYLDLLHSDRIRRGEVNSLGRLYAGAAVSWRFNPLWTLDNAVLINMNDPSALCVPSLRWSTGNNSEAIFGVQVGLGTSLAPGSFPRSEYGSASNTIFAGFTKYF